VALDGLSTVDEVSVAVTGGVIERYTFPAAYYSVYWNVMFIGSGKDLHRCQRAVVFWVDM
jgi:hypothetical protein